MKIQLHFTIIRVGMALVTFTFAVCLCPSILADDVDKSPESRLREAQEKYHAAESNSLRLANQLGSAVEGSAVYKTIEPKLHEAVRSSFDLQLELESALLDVAHAQINASRVRLERRKHLVDPIVSRRVSDLKRRKETAWEAESHMADSPRVATRGTESGGKKRMTPYQMSLYQSIGALKQVRDGRLEGIADCEQKLVEFRRIIKSQINPTEGTEDRELQDWKNAKSASRTLGSQIEALGEEVEIAEEKIALLEKRFVDSIQVAGEFVAVRGKVSSVNGDRVALDIGSTDGLEEGMRLKLFRDHRYIGEIQVVELTTASSLGTIDNDEDVQQVHIGDSAMLLLDPRLANIDGIEQGESIYNDKVRRFKFHVPHSQGSRAEMGQRFMRRYLGEKGNPPVFGMWGDPATDSLVVLAPAESETAIREFLVRGQVIATTGFDIDSGRRSLEDKMKNLTHQRKKEAFDLACLRIELIDLAEKESADDPRAERIQVEADLLSESLKVLDRKLAVVRKLAAVND